MYTIEILLNFKLFVFHNLQFFQKFVTKVAEIEITKTHSTPCSNKCIICNARVGAYYCGSNELSHLIMDITLLKTGRYQLFYEYFIYSSSC